MFQWISMSFGVEFLLSLFLRPPEFSILSISIGKFSLFNQPGGTERGPEWGQGPIKRKLSICRAFSKQISEVDSSQ
jgi:hypothetical protein